jgi:hypothetical protein
LAYQLAPDWHSNGNDEKISAKHSRVDKSKRNDVGEFKLPLITLVEADKIAERLDARCHLQFVFKQKLEAHL